jgi:hypothetical protein
MVSNCIYTRSVMISECISKFTRSSSPSVVPNTLHYRLEVHLQTCSITASKFTRPSPPSASLSSFNLALQVHLLVQVDVGLQAHLQTHSIMASQYILKFTRSRPPSAFVCSLDWCLQVLFQLCSSTVCSQIDHMYIYRDLDRYNMPYYDLTNVGTVIKTNMVDEMPCGYGTLRNHCCENMAPSLPQTCAMVSAAPQRDYLISQILWHPECTSITAGAFRCT